LSRVVRALRLLRRCFIARNPERIIIIISN
jgi:hypothetical protein